MTITTNMRCPVCGHEGDFAFTFETVTCMKCGTSDAARMFAVPALAPPEFDAAAIFPPDDIVAAVEKITNYFEIERQAKQWAFGKIQSRDEPALIGIEHVRNMAAAFQMALVPRLTQEAKQKIVIDTYNGCVTYAENEITPWSIADDEDRQAWFDAISRALKASGVE